MKFALPGIVILSAAASLGFGYTKSDVPEGWASMGPGTTGGTGGDEVTVSSFGALKEAAESSGKKIILVEKGVYNGSLSPASDKSILGVEPGVELHGTVRIAGRQNIIIRNIAIVDAKCDGYGSCRSGNDAINIREGSTNIWLDHVDVSDGQDGNCDINKASDHISITWCKFWYSYQKEHALSNLIASSDGESESEGKLNITYAFCWWADNVESRMPRGRFGKIHVVNNLYSSQRASYACGPGHNMQMLIENNVFVCTGSAIRDMGSNSAWKTEGNIGTTEGMDTDQGSVFTPPYEPLSQFMDADEVEEAVRAGAGNTMTLGQPVGLSLPAPVRYKPANPHLRASTNGWTVRNPGNQATTISIISWNGKTLFHSIRIEAGGAFHIPRHAPLPLLVGP